MLAWDCRNICSILAGHLAASWPAAWMMASEVVGWLAGSVSGWLAGWLAGCPAGSAVGWLTACAAGSLAEVTGLAGNSAWLAGRWTEDWPMRY